MTALDNCGLTAEAYTNDFRVIVPKYDIETRIQTVLLPEIRAQELEMGKGTLNLKVPSDRMEFSKLVFDITLESDAKSLKNFYKWMRETIYNPQDSVTDCVIQLMNPASFTATVEFRYKYVFPINIAPNALDISQTEPIRFTVNLAVNDLDIA